jgi:hypothetical protein
MAGAVTPDTTTAGVPAEFQGQIAQIEALGKQKTAITLALALVSAKQGVDNAVSGGVQGVAQKV